MIIICEKMKTELKKHIEKNEANIDKIVELATNCDGCNCKNNFVNYLKLKIAKSNNIFAIGLINKLFNK